MTTKTKAAPASTATKAVIDDETERLAALRAQMEADHGTGDLPEKARELIWAKAWEDGHAEGSASISNHYAELAEIALSAMPPPPDPDDAIDVGGREGQAKADFIAGYKDGLDKRFGQNAGDTASSDYMVGFGSAR